MTDADKKIRATLAEIDKDFVVHWDQAQYWSKSYKKSSIEGKALRLLAVLWQAMGEIADEVVKIKEHDEDSDSYEIHTSVDYILAIIKKAKGDASCR